MTTTQFDPQAQAAADARAVAAMPSAAGASVQQRIAAIIEEMRADIKERHALIHDMWVARVAQEHLLMLGPGGTGKSYAVRRLTQHIIGAKYFEKQLDETTDPSEVFGPPDIRAMVDEGKSKRVLTGMFAECTDGFLDEFFNANGPLLHSVMPVLNERIYSSNGVPTSVPLRSCFMGTNKLNADADQAALWDRVHIRHVVQYVQDRQNQIDLVGDAIARMALVGRGTGTVIPGQNVTQVTLEELDQAHREALALPISEAVVNQFFDIREELEKGTAQIEVSDRRVVEGMAAVMANAWVRGHDEVKVADLDVLANMWWTVQEQRSEARAVILSATNPGEKAALDLLDELDKVKAEIAAINKPEFDDVRKRKVGVEQVRNIDRLLDDANEHLDKARSAGADVTKIQETIDRANAEKLRIGKEVFGIDMAQQAALSAAAR
jgi:MoxR-like ATPase